LKRLKKNTRNVLRNNKGGIMASLRLDVVTPDRLVLSRDVDYVGAPGQEGEFGVLPGHIPLLAALTAGRLFCKAGGRTHWLFVSGGFVEVSRDRVTVLAESSEEVEKIDFERAEQARRRARERLESRRAEIDLRRALQSLARADARLSLRGR
jgi:F-type H+-transporting ATPase subunit epsilon